MVHDKVVEAVERGKEEVVGSSDLELDGPVQVEHSVMLCWVVLGHKLSNNELLISIKFIGSVWICKQAGTSDSCKHDGPFTMACDSFGRTA